MLKNISDKREIDYSPDALLIINELEAAHPIFSLREIPENYEKSKSEYINCTSKPISYIEFWAATQRFLAVLGDGHMSMYLAFKGDTLYIDISWIANDGKLYLLDENKKPTDIEIISIGRVSTSSVTAQVDIHYAAENEASRQRNYALFCCQEDMFMMAGCYYTSDEIELITSAGKKITCRLLPFDEYRAKSDSKPKYIIKHEMINDVFYIDFRAFQKSKSVDDTVTEIKNAVENGIKKFIIDIRDNGGGSSDVGEYLLSAMGMSAPRYGIYRRNSKLSCEQRGYTSSEEIIIDEPAVSAAVRNDNITLLVLTDVNTFSSATMLGVWVQDGKLGKIVGQTSSNKPNSYGDMLMVILPVYGAMFTISHKKFLRPDITANPDSLIPDIEVPFGEDILAAALKYMISIN